MWLSTSVLCLFGISQWIPFVAATTGNPDDESIRRFKGDVQDWRRKYCSMCLAAWENPDFEPVDATPKQMTSFKRTMAFAREAANPLIGCTAWARAMMKGQLRDQLEDVEAVSREHFDEVVAWLGGRRQGIERAVNAYISEQDCTEDDWPSPARDPTRNPDSADSGTERQQGQRRRGKQAGTGFGPPKDKKGSTRRKKGDPGMSISREDIGRRQGATSNNADSRSGQDDLWSRLSRLGSEVLRYFPSPFGDGSRGGAAGTGGARGGAGGVARPVLRLGPGR